MKANTKVPKISKAKEQTGNLPDMRAEQNLHPYLHKYCNHYSLRLEKNKFLV